MDEILYTTPEQQIEKLKSQHLIISDEAEAADSLRLYGYSNLIKSYRGPYIIDIDGTKRFRDGVTFDQLVSLYMLDKNLRTAIMASMLDFEEHIKETAADIVADRFGTHESEYLRFRNYRDRRTRNPRFTLSAILRKMNDTLNTGKDPIHHYAIEHGIVPPWILFKGIYFSTIVNFVKFFKNPEKIEMAHRLYGSDLAPSDDKLLILMMDTFFIALEYRNLAAHGGRIYDHDCSNRLHSTEIFGEGMDPPRGFSLLLFLLRFLKHREPFNVLNITLNDELNRHCSLFPEDVTYLGQILHVNITRRNLVYASPNGKIFHLDPHCSGLHDAIEMESQDAIEKGLRPCKRCFPSSNDTSS